MKKKKTLSVSLLICVTVLFVVWLVYGNTAVEISEVLIVSDRLPKSFSGFRVAQVSDLHNTEFGEDNARLVEKLKKINPDIIAITGDLVDSRRTDTDVAVEFAKKAAEIAPCYYVTGNHEARIDKFSLLESELKKAGITVLRNEVVRLEKNGEAISVMGMDDPGMGAYGYFSEEDMPAVDAKLKALTENQTLFTLLLSHRPNMFEVYCDNEVDVVLSGHAHGGQFRVPFGGGLFAPDQGLFPKYDSGLYTCKVTNMVVSRGLGNSIVPLRINNTPEIVLIELRTE